MTEAGETRGRHPRDRVGGARRGHAPRGPAPRQGTRLPCARA